jgi:hypothetical protein
MQLDPCVHRAEAWDHLHHQEEGAAGQAATS